MKNIIRWKTPSDRVFVRMLQERIRLVLTPIERRKLEDQALRVAAEQFARLSVRKKQEQVSLFASQYCSKRGYKQLPKNRLHVRLAEEGLKWFATELFQQDQHNIFWGGIRRSAGGIDFLGIFVLPKVASKFYRELKRSFLAVPAYEANAPLARMRNPPAVHEHYLIFVLSKASHSTLSNSFNTYEPHGPGVIIGSSPIVVPHRLPLTVKSVRFVVGEEYPTPNLILQKKDGTNDVAHFNGKDFAYYVASSEGRKQRIAKGKVTERIKVIHLVDNVQSLLDLGLRLKAIGKL